MKDKVSLTDFDVLALSYITFYMTNLDAIINLSLTCKEYYAELHNLLNTSNALLLKTFNIYNKYSYDTIIKESYYKFSNLKYYFNTHAIPLPNNVDEITYNKVKNTELIYNHFFYEHNQKSDYTIYKFLHNLFIMKYSIKKIKTNDLECFFDLRKSIDVYNNKYKYIVYNSELTEYNQLDTPLFCDDGKYSSCIVNYRYNYIISHLELYALNIFLHNKCYESVINILDSLEFNYSSTININELYYKITKTIDIDCYSNTTIYIKLTMLYIYIHYIGEVYKKLDTFNKNKKAHYYSTIINIIDCIKKYYSNEAIYKDNYNRGMPKYFFDYMKFNILDYSANLI